MVVGFAGLGIHIGSGVFVHNVGDNAIILNSIDNVGEIIWTKEGAAEVADITVTRDMSDSDRCIVFGAIGFNEADNILRGIDGT